MFDVFAHDAYTESVVHRFVEEITVKLDNVGMVLRFEQLNCFFLYTKYKKIV